MSRQTSSEPVEVVVQIRENVRAADRAYVQDKILRACGRAPGKVLFARVELTAHEDPAREQPATANAELDIEGHLVRARVAAATMHEAVDLLDSRLRARVALSRARPDGGRTRRRAGSPA